MRTYFNFHFYSLLHVKHTNCGIDKIEQGIFWKYSFMQQKEDFWKILKGLSLFNFINQAIFV